MEYKQTLQNILTKFKKDIAREPLTLVDNIYSHITIDGQREVLLNLDEENGALQLISPIAPDNPELYADLLELNMFRKQLAGARFVLIRDINSIALLRHIEIKNLTLQEFEVLIEKSLGIAQKWSEPFEKNTNPTDDSDKTPMLVMDEIFNRAQAIPHPSQAAIYFLEASPYLFKGIDFFTAPSMHYHH